MHRYARDLKTLLSQHSNRRLAGPMKRYMRDQFDYLGIKSPALTKLLAQHTQRYGLPPLSDLDPIVRDLWALPQREFQYAATSLIGQLENELPSGFIRTLEFLMVHKSWWDTVDTIATGALGVHFQRYPKVKEKYLPKWRKSKNFWLRRACILFQLGYKDATDFPLLRAIIRENAGSKEFFINKAIGWALRQYTRIDPQGVRKFVEETPLNPLSAREALRWMERRGL